MDSPEDFLPERSMIYGHRHQPNSTYQIKKNCLNTFYHFNELGFRDELLPHKDSSKRVLVLGDSFMEGVGVSEEERLSDLLEKETGIPHLNFSMADKGTTQSFIIYDSIASKYDHSAILIAFFPINDFIDDDPQIGKNENSIRPCWIGEYPNYQLQFVPKEAPKFKESSTWKHFLKTHTYTYDALFYLKESMKEKIGSRKNYPNTGYFAYSKEQFNRMKFSLLKIKEKAGSRSITLLCIPSHLDLLNPQKKSSVEDKLSIFCDSINVEFIGLYDHFQSASEKPVEEYYFSCDSHWNKEGHKKVKSIVLKESFVYR